MLEPLFDAELDYQPGMAPLTSQGDGGRGEAEAPRVPARADPDMLLAQLRSWMNRCG
jgi:hypothetical protein